MERRSEAEVKKEINRKLKSKALGYFFHYASYGGLPGAADKLGLINGKFVAIESKAPHRKSEAHGGMSSAQRIFRKNVESNWGIYILAYGWEDVETSLKKAGLIC